MRLTNFLTPRDCPRVGWHVSSMTTPEDRARFFACRKSPHALAIESCWLEPMRTATLYLYEFAPEDFRIQDACVGYSIATRTQRPIARHVVTDLLAELTRRGVEVRFLPHLLDIADAVKASTLDWSLCRMRGAKPRG